MVEQGTHPEKNSTQMKTYQFKINGQDFDVTVESADETSAKVTVNGETLSVDILEEAAAIKAPADKTAVAAPVKPVEGIAAAGCDVTSPLPGVIVEICVVPGQAVKAGEKVAVLEAMKMENDILAEQSGTVTAVHAAKGDSVLEGARIVTIG